MEARKTAPKILTRYHLEDCGQDLIWLTVEHTKHGIIGEVVDVPRYGSHPAMILGKLIDMEMARSKNYIGILNYKESCTDVIKYKVVGKEEIIKPNND